MNKVAKSTLSFLIISFIVGFILLFLAMYVYSNRTQNDPTLTVHSLRNGIVFRAALIRTLRLLPPLIICIFVTAFSIFFTLTPFQSESFAFPVVGVPSFTVLLGFLIIVVLSELLFIPKLYRDSENGIYTSKLVQASLVHAKELYADNQPQKALEALDYYLKYVKNDRNVRNLYEQIMNSMYRTKKKKQQVEPLEEKSVEPENFYEKGKLAYQKEDYYTALYYLERALSLHRDNREIKELYSMTVQRVRKLLGALTKDEKEASRLVSQKEKALEHLERGEYYEAYDIFLSLANKYPGVYDLELYLQETEEKLARNDFRIDELEEHRWMPSYDNVMFRDTQGILDVVERIIPAGGTFYLYNIHRYSENNGTIAEESWKYGKWIEDGIRLKNRRGFRKITGQKDRYYIYPAVNPGYLLFFSDADRLKNQLTVYEYFTRAPALKQSGLDIESGFLYLSKKVGTFFSIYVLSLVLGGIAWSKRSIYEFPPFFKIIIFAFSVPLLSYFFHHLYVDANAVLMYAHRYITRFMFKDMNILAYTVLLQVIIAAAATIFYLSKGSEVE